MCSAYEWVVCSKHFICFGHIFFQWLMALSSQNTLNTDWNHNARTESDANATKQRKEDKNSIGSYVKIRDNYGNYVNLDSFLPSETVLDLFLLLLFFLYVEMWAIFESSASAMHTITRSRVQFVKRPQVFLFCVHFRLSWLRFGSVCAHMRLELTVSLLCCNLDCCVIFRNGEKWTSGNSTHKSVNLFAFFASSLQFYCCCGCWFLLSIAFAFQVKNEK